MAEPEPAVPRAPRLEWPTLGLALLIHGGWLALTWFHASIPLFVLVPAAAWIIAWHGSLQHEVMHGHPTRSRRINDAIGMAPLSLWLPYARYRATHLAHHHDERLTDPLDDPESWYWRAEDWRALGPLGRALARAQATLVGRLVIGPIWSIGRFWWSEARAILAGDRALAAIWARHALLVGLVLAWIVFVCGMPLWFYALVFVYPGTALSLVRSFAEHRWAETADRRTAIVENGGALGLLFLFNNLHAVHHRFPTIPWYRLPGFFRAHRRDFVGEPSGPIYRGYGEIARRWLVRPHDDPVHPRS